MAMSYVPSTSVQVDLSSAAIACLADLIKARAGGNPSEVVERLLLSVLPEFRLIHSRVAELEAHIQQQSMVISSLQGELQQARSPATSGMGGEDSDEGTDDPSSASGPGSVGGGGGGGGSRRRFFKSIRDLDPSARRKRKAKFCRGLVG